LTDGEDELKARDGDQRRALLDLTTPTRGTADYSEAALAARTKSARRCFNHVAGPEFPQAGDAGMTLDSLDRGIFKPI
jgi:hypothetical protein